MRRALCSLLALAAGAAHAQEEPGGPREEPPAEASHKPCDENFKEPCPQGEVCLEARCVLATRTASNSAPRREAAPRVRPFRLGVQTGFFFGLGSSPRNPRPAYTVQADFGFPTGRAVRWHVEVGYEELGAYEGLRFNPFVLGYTIPLPVQGVELELEVLLAILQSEVLFDDGFAIALSSGLRAQLVLRFGTGYAAIAPLGFEIRYAYGTQDIGVRSGSGVNWPLLFTVGLEL